MVSWPGDLPVWLLGFPLGLLGALLWPNVLTKTPNRGPQALTLGLALPTQKTRRPRAAPTHPFLPPPQAGERGRGAEPVPGGSEGEASGSRAVPAQLGGHAHEPGEGHRCQDEQPLHRPPEVHGPPHPLPHRPPAGRLPVTGRAPWRAQRPISPSNKEHVSFLLRECTWTGGLCLLTPCFSYGGPGVSCLGRPQSPPGERGQPRTVEAPPHCSLLTTRGTAKALTVSLPTWATCWMLQRECHLLSPLVTGSGGRSDN